MFSILGKVLLYLALICASIQTFLPLIGIRQKNIYLLAFAPSFAFCQLCLIFCAYSLLSLAFVSNDFSLAYVAANSHANLPLMYKFTAVWGGHEGSLLLWVLLLSAWTMVFAKLTHPSRQSDYALVILGAVSLSFLIFLCFTSNPFTPSPIQQGQDLNPLLQDPGFLIHPPMLYIGYVGMCVPFALTLSGLITNQLDRAWARLTRQYTIAAWSFLTLGITLGSWWAYRVLGWGGFWFWDPVENASLLPWLCAIALIHNLIVVEKKQQFERWAALLAIICFSLSVLGTFLVRSGILVSTHTFANDPSRGIFLLIMLGFITLLALFFYIKFSLRASTSKLSLTFFSRGSSLILNTILFFTATATVLLGTLYPLIMDALHLGNISVGAPYFNKVLLPMVFLTLSIMSLAAYLQWEKTSLKQIFKKSMRHLIFSFLFALVISMTLFTEFNIATISTLGLSFWVLISVVLNRNHSIGMMTAHSGFAILMIGILLSSHLSIEKEVSLKPGNSVQLGPYQFFFLDTVTVQAANYRGIRGVFEVMKGKHHVTNLYPEKRIYTVRDAVMTNVDIHPSIFRDLYIALGQPLDRNYWSVRLYYKPFMRWIWGGGFIMMCGGVLILLKRRKLVYD